MERYYDKTCIKKALLIVDHIGDVLPEQVCYSRVTWKIRNFFNGPLDRNKIYESKEFEINLPIRITWRLALKHRKISVGDNYVTVISLQPSDPSTAIFPCDFRIKIYTLDTEKKLRFDGNFPRTDRRVKCQFPGIYDILRGRKKTARTQSGELEIRCNFFLSMVAYLEKSDIGEDLKLLSKNLRDLYKSGDFKNLDIKVGHKNFSVHSAIAGIRSPYIANLLRNDTDIRNIDLTGYGSKDKIEGLIKYWYSGHFDEVSRESISNSWIFHQVKEWQEIEEFIEKVKQEDLKPYYFIPSTVLSTTLLQTTRLVNWALKSPEFCKEIKEYIKRRGSYDYLFRQLPWKLHFFTKAHTSGLDHNYGFIQKEDHTCFSVEEVGEINCLQPVCLVAFFIGDSGKEYGQKITMSWFDGNSRGKYYFQNFMSHDEFDRLQRNLLERDTFRLGCRIHYGTGIEENDIKTDSITIQHPYKVLSTSMKQLFENHETGYITLIANGERFRVHMAVLAARSKYFPREFFGQNPTEFTVDYIGLADLIMILKYMYYAEKIQLNLELALRLYPAVRKYEINCLDGLCSEFLQKHATVEKALAIFEKANEFNDDHLKNAALNIIRKNWNRISTTREWHSLQNCRSALASEIEAGIRRINSGLNQDSSKFVQS